MTETTDYTDDFKAGARATIDLLRTGASVDQVESAVLGDAPVDLDEYGGFLRELRTIMGTDSPDIYGSAAA
jgi:hypothetical protein